MKLKPTMKSIHSVECKLVVAKTVTVVHFSTLHFTIQNRLAIEFVTASLAIAEVTLSVAEICQLCS